MVRFQIKNQIKNQRIVRSIENSETIHQLQICGHIQHQMYNINHSNRYFSGNGNLDELDSAPFDTTCSEAWFTNDCTKLDKVRALCEFAGSLNFGPFSSRFTRFRPTSWPHRFSNLAVRVGRVTVSVRSRVVLLELSRFRCPRLCHHLLWLSLQSGGRLSRREPLQGRQALLGHHHTGAEHHKSV